MKRFFGVLMLLAGAGFACWLAYDHISGRADGRNPLAGFGLCLGLFVVGVRWACGSAPSSGVDPDAGHPSRRVSAPPSRGFDMDLSNLTASGWGLLLATFAVVVAGAGCFAFWANDAEWLTHDRRWMTPIGLAGVGLAVGFFLLGKFALARLGLPICRYRDE